MKPVDQTRIGVGGNCFQAVLASLLEVPLEAVPDFCNIYPEETWYEQCEGWLVALHRKVYVTLAADNEAICRAYMPLFQSGICYLAAGPSASNGLSHVVIYQNGRLVHDPNPSRAGLAKVDTWEFVLNLP